MSNKQGIVHEANLIVTNHLVNSFLLEVEYYLIISDYGNQHIVIHQKRLACVLDATSDRTEEGLIKKFCELFTNKSDILVDVTCVDEDVDIPYLKMTLQSGLVYYIQDFSSNYFKI